MPRRLSLPLALAAVTALALGGCASEPAQQGPVQLTFRQFDPPEQIGGLEQAVESWNASHPRIQVELETLTDPDNAQQFAREANSGSGPDVVQIANANVKDLAEPRILLSLDQVTDEEPADPPIEDYRSVDLTTFDGKTWALPWTIDTFSLAIDPALLEQAGAQVPTTWEELATTAADLSSGDTAGFCFPGGSGAGSGQWFPINYYLWSHGSTLVEEQGDRWVAGASEADLVGAIDYFNGLFTSRATPRSFIAIDQLTSPEITDGLANGSCAMTLMSPQTFRNAVAVNDDLTTAPAPDGLTDGSTHLGGRSLGINASTDHPLEAWRFIQYLNSREAFETLGNYPASIEQFDGYDFPKSEAGFQQQVPHAQSFARYIGGPVPVATLQKIVNAEFGAVYSGQKDSAAAARSINEQIGAELERQ